MNKKHINFKSKLKTDKDFKMQFYLVFIICILLIITAIIVPISIHNKSTKSVMATITEANAETLQEITTEEETTAIPEGAETTIIEDNGTTRIQAVLDENGSFIYTTTTTQPPTTKKKVATTTTKVATTATQTTPVVVLSESSNSLPVTAILQNPELPSGCEVTSLTIVLNYLGFNADKCDISDNYLPKGSASSGNPYKEFLGNPRSSSGVGCYAPVIVNTANSYINSHSGGKTARNISGAAPSALYAEIDAGHPVIVWATQGMRASHATASWTSGGQKITWRSPFHCLVLIGYNSADDTLTFADPLRGICSYSRTTFEARYAEMGRQAVVIY